MPKPSIEYEICLAGKIKISDLNNLEIVNKVEKKIINLNSKYFDDDDLYLLNNNLGLRLRYENSCWVQTLKYEKRDQSRLEWNSKPSFANNKGSPKINARSLPNSQILEKNGCSLKKNLQVIAQTFRKKFSIKIKRTSWIIFFDKAKIEISYDTGFIRTSKKQEKISEIELEIIEGEPYKLWLLAKHLIKIFPKLTFEFKSKAFRGFLLCGLDWQKFNPSSNSIFLQSNCSFEQKLKETLLVKNKLVSFFISMIFDRNKEETKLILIETIIELKYIFQFLILINISESKNSLSLYKSLRCRCGTLENELKMSNTKKCNAITTCQKTQLLISDIGLFANSVHTLQFKNNAKKDIVMFFLKLKKSVSKRRDLISFNKSKQETKGGCKLITYNSNFFLSLGISKTTIVKNRSLELSISK